MAAPNHRTPHAPNHYSDTLQGWKETTSLLRNPGADWVAGSDRFVKQVTTITVASQAEIAVYEGPSTGDVSAGVRGISPRKNFEIV